jgi:hypothetical protein
MYTARKTELGKLRSYERELTGLYAEALLRRHNDDARRLFERRRTIRRAILQAEEWNVEEVAAHSLRESAVEEELARVS